MGSFVFQQRSEEIKKSLNCILIIILSLSTTSRFIRARITEEIDQAINRQSKCAKIDTLKEFGGGITNKQDVPNTMNAYIY